MIEMKSPFSDFVNLCKTYGACADDGAGGDWVYKTGEAGGKEMTIEQGIIAASKDSTVEGSWTVWALNCFGKELASDVRYAYIQATVTKPEEAMAIIAKLSYLETSEITLLKSLYEGKITSDKEGVVVKYVQADCTGKGFITPTDATSMKFEAVSEGLYKVEGVEKAIDDWITKVSGTLLVKAATAERVG